MFTTENLSELKKAKAEWSARLLAVPEAVPSRASRALAGSAPAANVVGVGVGEKLVDKAHTGILAVKFLVRKKYPKAHLGRREALPTFINGLPVDVEEVGVFRAFRARRKARSRRATAAAPEALNPRQRYRPARPGSSIGFQDPENKFVMAGTFGATVKKGTDRYILSNNHVLADENRLPIGAAIFQPGLLDKGDPAKDKVAELSKFVRLTAQGFNRVDCAIAIGTPKSVLSNSILVIGPPKGAGVAAIDMVVHKSGRTTGYTAGRVTSIDTDVKVNYETGQYLFKSQIIVVGLEGHPFSDAGDSGSLILDRSSNQAVALLFAGSQTHTIANPIKQVLDALGVTLVL